MRAYQRTYQGLLVCRRYARTWAYPREVAELLRAETAGMSVLQLFGGRAAFGMTLDADRATAPNVVGNAFFPPFRCESFDVVLVDPPWDRAATTSVWIPTLVPAACLARRRVWWFSGDCITVQYHGLKLLRWWVVMPTDAGPLRYLAELKRTRHPEGCYPRPRADMKAWPAPIRKYDWRSRIEEPQLPLASGAVS